MKELIGEMIFSADLQLKLLVQDAPNGVRSQELGEGNNEAGDNHRVEARAGQVARCLPLKMSRSLIGGIGARQKAKECRYKFKIQ